MKPQEVPKKPRGGATTTVEVACAGHVRAAVGAHRLTFAFSGDTLRDFLEQFSARYPCVQPLLISPDARAATSRGWLKADPTLTRLMAGTLRKNPQGEQTRCYAAVLVNGRFNELLQGLDTPLRDGDRVGLLYPFMFCC